MHLVFCRWRLLKVRRYFADVLLRPFRFRTLALTMGLAGAIRPRINNRSHTLHQTFKDLLHQYKVETFHTEHGRQSVEEVTAECMAITEEILEDRFHYHFHKLPNADRAEIINMINNYVREAILPPVVEKLVRRQVLAEKRIDALLHLTEQMFEILAAERQAV